MSNQVIAILFDGNSENIFYAGQLVTGHVHVQTSQRIKIRGVRLEVTVKAQTSWSEGTGDDSTNYSGKEEYMNLEISLIGSRSKDSVMFLDPSVSNYPFSFVLPPELPPSYEDNVGHIRYRAKAVIDRPLMIDDKAEVLLTVIRLLDLNREPPHLREPQVIHSEALASGCCCIGGFVEINATINRGCFVPGETISIDGEIVNRTNSSIQYSTITLVQDIEYCATGKDVKVYRTTHRLTVLAKSERPGLRPITYHHGGYTDRLSNISIIVPQVKSTRLDGCTIINIRHYIQITSVFHACYSRSTASTEVVIGNVPLQGQFQPSVVTSQPIEFPVPYYMSVGCAPSTNVPTLGFNNSRVKAWEHDTKDLPQVHVS